MPRMTAAEYQAFLARFTKPQARQIADGVAREIDLHNDILSECRRRGWLVIHGRTDRPATVTVGSPDFVILADQGRTIYVEAKARREKRSMEQLAFHAWAARLGHTIHVVRNMDEFLNLTSDPTIEATQQKQT